MRIDYSSTLAGGTCRVKKRVGIPETDLSVPVEAAPLSGYTAQSTARNVGGLPFTHCYTNLQALPHQERLSRKLRQRLPQLSERHRLGITWPRERGELLLGAVASEHGEESPCLVVDSDRFVTQVGDLGASASLQYGDRTR